MLPVTLTGLAPLGKRNADASFSSISFTYRKRRNSEMLIGPVQAHSAFLAADTVRSPRGGQGTPWP